MSPAPGWYDDPVDRYDLRYWDGESWTDHVSSGGAVSRASVDLGAHAYPAPTRPMRASRDRQRASRGGRWLTIVALALVAVPVIVGIVVAVSRDGSSSSIQPFDTADGACEAWWQANVASARDGWDDARFGRELRRLAEATEPVDATLASLLRTIASNGDAAEIRSSIETAYQRCVGLHRWRGATDEELAIVASPARPR